MTSLLKFAKRWVPILLIASAGMYFLTGRILEGDKSTPAVRAFVAGNARILQQVGPVEEVKIIKRVSVDASTTAGAYRLYTVDVRGVNAVATVVVRLEGDTGDEGIALQSIIR